MATNPILNRKVWFDAYDVTGDLNAVAMVHGSEAQDATTFSDTYRNFAAGLKFTRAEIAGFWQAGSSPDKIDDIIQANLQVVDKPLTVGVQAGAEGEIAQFFLVTLGEYTPAGRFGEMFRFDVSAHGRGSPLLRGTLLHTGAETSSGNGTAYQAGAVSATQKLYAALHVTTQVGTSLDVKIQSDSAEGMPSPTDRITFTQATGIDGQWATPVAGAITDDWWRVSYTVVGGSFTFACVMGIF